MSTRGDGYELSLANALWGQKGFPFLEEAFLKLNREHYGARTSHELDFREPPARRLGTTINRWVAEETKDRIQ